MCRDIDYLNYINSLNLEKLPEDLLESMLKRIGEIIEERETAKYKFPKNKIAKIIVFLVFLLISLGNFSFSIANNLGVICNLFCAIPIFANSAMLISNLKSIYRDYMNFKENDNVKEAKRIKETLEDILFQREKLKNKELESSENKTIEFVKQIGEEDLRVRITEIEGKILLLPKEQEKSLQNRLQKALATYKENTKTLSAGGISLILKSKLDYLQELNKELDDIEATTQNNALFISEECFLKSLEDNTREYLATIGEKENKDGVIMNLMVNLGELLKCQTDITKQIAIQESFAVCFWKTMEYLDSNEIILCLNWIRPVFFGGIILEGERYLDNLEQSIDVLGARSTLFNYKRCESYKERDYVKKLVFTVKRFMPKNEPIVRMRRN